MKTIKRLKRYFKRFGVQISVFFLTISITIILLFSSVVYIIISQIFVKEAISKTSNMVQMSGVNIETYIDRIKGEVHIFAMNPMLQQYLKRDNGEQRENLLKQIQILLNSDSNVKSVVVVSKDGRILSNEQNLNMSLSGDMMKESWYTDAIKNNMPILTGARMQSFSTDKDNWVISISTEIKDEAGENLGVMLIDMKYSVIEDHINYLDLGKEGYLFILNDKQELVYYLDTSYFTDPAKKQELIKIFQTGESYNKIDNVFTYHTIIENAKWTMVGVLSLDGIKVLEQQLFEMVVFTGIALFMMVLIFGSLFTKKLTKPMSELEKGMQEIEKLEELYISQNSFYEVELLADKYNKMILKIKQLMLELSQKEKNLRYSEINVLISQINPHFLYNTLDTIVWMAEFNDSKKVISLTKSLASFFRLSLNNGKELVSVGEEIEHVKQYLYIQKERYEDKLNYHITVEESLWDFSVPKIILQPIVENSIYHGIKPLDGNGEITITAAEEGEKIIFIVTDNGIGFDKGADRNNHTTKLGGFGLYNVDQRIKLYYGNDYGITVDSEPGAGCKVTIIIKKTSSFYKESAIKDGAQ